MPGKRQHSAWKNIPASERETMIAWKNISASERERMVQAASGRPKKVAGKIVYNENENGTSGKRLRDEADEAMPARKRQKVSSNVVTSYPEVKGSQINEQVAEGASQTAKKTSEEQVETNGPVTADKAPPDSPITSIPLQGGTKRRLDHTEDTPPQLKRQKCMEAEEKSGNCIIAGNHPTGAPRRVVRKRAPNAESALGRPLGPPRKNNVERPAASQGSMNTFPPRDKQTSVPIDESRRPLANSTTVVGPSGSKNSALPEKDVHVVKVQPPKVSAWAYLPKPQTKKPIAAQRSGDLAQEDRLRSERYTEPSLKISTKAIATASQGADEEKVSPCASSHASVLQKGSLEPSSMKGALPLEEQQLEKKMQGSQARGVLANKDPNRRIKDRGVLKALDPENVDRLRPVGLQNHNLSSYFNSVLQCLHGASSLVSHYMPRASEIYKRMDKCGLSKEYFERFKNEKTSSWEDTMIIDKVKDTFGRDNDVIPISAFTGELFQSMKGTTAAAAVSPFLLRQAFEKVQPDYDMESSQDAHQFLTEYLKRLEEEDYTETNETGRHKTAVQKTFGGRTTTRFRCSACGYQHDIVRNFLCLDLDVSARKQQTSLETCLKSFPDPETIDKYTCYHIGSDGVNQGCDKVGTTEKEKYLKEGPEYLVLHLQRMFGKHKIVETQVTFPTGTMDLSPWVDPEPSLKEKSLKYEVIAVVEHQGKRSDRGHYTAIRKEYGKWWLINDNQVKELSEDELNHRRGGYIFFLRKVEKASKTASRNQEARSKETVEEGEDDLECPPTPRGYESC